MNYSLFKENKKIENFIFLSLVEYCKIYLMKKFSLLIPIILIFLNSCVQSTSMLGPAYTLVSTGNVIQASASVGANKIVEKETGMTTSQLISNKLIESTNVKKKVVDDEFVNFVNSNIKKTRIIIKNQKKF